jgi:hypothetical protein
MASGKAWYWLAVGVLALGLNGEYQSGGLPWAHEVVEHGRAAVQRVAEEASGHVAMARIMFGHDLAPAVQVQAAVAHVKADVACVRSTVRTRQQVEVVGPDFDQAEEIGPVVDQAQEIQAQVLQSIQPQLEQARLQIEMARIQVERAKMLAAAQAGHVKGICPYTGRVVVNAPKSPMVTIPQIAVNVPQVRVEIPEVQ